MTDYLVLPDREDLAGFKLPSVLPFALDLYARCYAGGAQPDWPEHRLIVQAVLDRVGAQLGKEQATWDAQRPDPVPYTALGNNEPIPAAWPPALREVVDRLRRAEGWDELGNYVGKPPATRGESADG